MLLANRTGRVPQSPPGTAAGCEKRKTLGEIFSNRQGKSTSCLKEHVALCTPLILSQKSICYLRAVQSQLSLAAASFWGVFFFPLVELYALPVTGACVRRCCLFLRGVSLKVNTIAVVTAVNSKYKNLHAMKPESTTCKCT